MYRCVQACVESCHLVNCVYLHLWCEYSLLCFRLMCLPCVDKWLTGIHNESMCLLGSGLWKLCVSR